MRTFISALLLVLLLPLSAGPRTFDPAGCAQNLQKGTYNPAGCPSAAKTYATWNPNDKGANVVLSNGNLTASAGGNSVRATLSNASGKWYWEVKFDSSNGITPGIAKSNMGLTSYVGQDANGWSYYSANGNKINNAVQVAYGNSYVAGDVVGIALDIDNGKLFFAKNNVWQNAGDPVAGTNAAYTGLSGTFFAAVGDGTVGGVSIANFGATALTYTPPAGYNAGWYN